MSVWLISPIVTCSLLGELAWCLAVFVSWACMHAHACTVQDNVGSLHCRCFMAFTCCLSADFRWLFHSFHWWIVELRTQWAADNGQKHGDQILCTSIMRSFDDRLKKKKSYYYEKHIRLTGDQLGEYATSLAVSAVMAPCSLLTLIRTGATEKG